MKKRRAFTIMELMLAVLVLTIMASIAIVGYQGYRDRAAILVDETNQAILHAAVKLYAYDTNALPASLSEMRPQDMERAFALVTEGKRPYTFLAYLQEWVGIGTAEAQNLPGQYYNNDKKVITCPLDPTPPGGGDRVSYALSPDARENGNPRSLAWLLNPANARFDLIVEADVQQPKDVQEYAYRHGGRQVCVVTSSAGRPSRKKHQKHQPD